MTIENLVMEREKTHGCFLKHAEITQDLKAIISKHLMNIEHPMWIPAQEEALDMICHKIGRLVAGDPYHIDHWADIAGYAILASKAVEGLTKSFMPLNTKALAENIKEIENNATPVDASSLVLPPKFSGVWEGDPLVVDETAVRLL